MDLRIADIRRRVAQNGGATEEDVDALDDILEAEGASAELLILRGQLIQLVREDDPEELEEALACFQEALEIDPGSAEAHEEIGHFLDDIAEDPEEALPFFRKAIELGAGASAEEGLRDVLGQLGREESQ
jgi:tetratricopeptide (TPR) repeat protein